MFKRIFKWGTDDNDVSGWLMVNMPDFNAASGIGVAHDALEHFDYGTSAEDEYQAFGSILWGRVLGQFDSFFPGRRVRTTAGEHAMYLLEDLIEVLVGTDCRVDPIRTRPLGDDEEYEPEKVLNALRRLLISAIAENGEGRFADEQATEENATIVADRVIGWMRKGYRRAARRWAHTNREQVAQLFFDLMTEVDRITSHPMLEYRDEYCGLDELHVSVSPKRMDFIVRVKEYRDPYA